MSEPKLVRKSQLPEHLINDHKFPRQMIEHVLRNFGGSTQDEMRACAIALATAVHTSVPPAPSIDFVSETDDEIVMINPMSPEVEIVIRRRAQ